MRIFQDINEAYKGILRDIYFYPEFKTSPRGMEILETLNYGFKVLYPTSDPIITNDSDRNEKIESYTNKEMELYNSCSNKADDFAKASKFWNNIKNPDDTINSAYGYLIWKNRSFGNPVYEYGDKDYDCGMRTPWDWAKRCLLMDKDTRQAFIKFSLPEHHWIGCKDQTCTMHGIFHIREDRLHLTITMRSNDVVLGLVYDMPWFCSLIDKMLTEIKFLYPELEKGTYTHISHSMHMYTKDADIVSKMIGL